MLIDTNRIAAVICPECSNAVLSHISAFSFSGGRSVKIKCPVKGCGCECLTALQKNKKFKITIQCPFCGGIHSFSIDSGKLWNKELITLPCPDVGINSFFFGSAGKVEEALKESLFSIEELYRKTMDGLDGFDDEYDDYYEDGTEDDIIYDIIDELHELHRKNALSCICGSESLSISEVDNKILLSCPRCRRSKLLSANEQTLAMIINATAIVLGK